MGNPGYSNSINTMDDIFTDILGGGQSIIDEAAEAVGIEKGGAIDTAITGAAKIGRNVTGVDSVDSAIKKFTGGSKAPSTTTTTTSTGAPSTGFFKSISKPWAAGGAVVGGVGLHLAFKRWWLSIVGGLATGVVTGVVAPKIVAKIKG